MYKGEWSLVNFVLAWGIRLTFNQDIFPPALLGKRWSIAIVR